MRVWLLLPKAERAPYTPAVSLKVLVPLLAGSLILLVLAFTLSPRVGFTLVFIALGFTMVWKTTWFLDVFGRVPWAEQHLTTSFGAGFGGSWMWYKLLGVVVIAVALLYLTGVLHILLVNTLGVFFGGSLPE